MQENRQRGRQRFIRRWLILIVLPLLLFAAPQSAQAEELYPDEEALAEKVSLVLDYLDLYGKDEEEIVFGVYNYICQTVEYDYAATGKYPWDGESLGFGQTAYEALCWERAVCAGISRAITLLLDELGVPSRVVLGNSTGGPHAWNLVELYGEWYFMDATGDLGAKDYKCFLKTLPDLGDYVIWPESGFDVGDFDLAETSYPGSFSTQTEQWGEYTINPGFGKVTIFSYTGTEKDVVIPAQINGRPVKRLAQYFIQFNDTMESLTISEGIERLDHLLLGHCEKLRTISFPSTAMYTGGLGRYVGLGGLIDHCEALETVTVAEGNPYMRVVDKVLYDQDMKRVVLYPAAIRTAVLQIPDGVESFSDDAFAGNPYLEEVIFPDSLKKIGYWAFSNCRALKKINIPESCQQIGQYAFQGTQISEIHIPAATTVIVAPAFSPALETITVDENNPFYYAVDNVLFDHDGNLCCYAAQKPDVSYTIPSFVTGIGMRAFFYAENLLEIVIPEGVTQIDHAGFYGCSSVETVVLPSSLDEIKDTTFMNCTHLAKLVVPASVEMNGDHVLANCGNVIIFGEEGSPAQDWAEQHGFAFRVIGSSCAASGSCGNGVVWALSEDGVLTLTGSGDLELGDGAPWIPYNKLIKSVIVSDGITSLGHGAFSACVNLKSAALPDSLAGIGDYSFAYCDKLRSIIIPGNVASIGRNAFRSAGLTSITIPDSVTLIDEYAFEDTGISEIHIPAATTNIRYYALPPALERITVDENNPHYYAADNVLFNRSGGLCRYAAQKPDVSYTIPSGVNRIETGAFREAGNLHEIILPEGVASIGTFAFYGCSNVETIVLPYTLTTIGGMAFGECGRLAKLLIPLNVDTIADDALYGTNDTLIAGEEGSYAQTWAESHGFAFQCIEVEELSGSCGDGVVWALSKNGVLTLTGSGDLELGDGAPWAPYRKKIKRVVVSDGITSLGHGAFISCANLESAALPDSLAGIGDFSFAYCDKLSSIIIPGNVASIGQFAFRFAGLTSITIPDSVTLIDEYAFQGVDTLTDIYYAGTEEQWRNIEIRDVDYSNSALKRVTVHYGIIPTFTLPAGLTSVEAETFAGISANAVVFIPATVTSIADDAFDKNVLILAPAGSYAVEWAHANGLVCYLS